MSYWLDRVDQDPTPANLRRRPQGAEPVLPRNPSDLTDQALMELFSQFVRALQYAKVQYAKACSRAASLRQRERVMRAKAYVLSSGNRENRAAMVDLNPGIAKVADEALVAEAEANLYFAIFDGYNEAKALLSRELSRRIDLEKSRGQGM